MLVPNVSQLIDGQGGDRCGEACLAACLQALNIDVSMLDVVKKLSKPPDQATSTIGDLLHAASLYNTHAQQLNTQEDMMSELLVKHYTIILLYNAFLDPLPYPNAPSWFGNHFVVVETVGPQAVEIMDPLAYPGTQQCAVSVESFVKAVHAVPIIPWGLSLWIDVSHKPTIPQGPKGCK